MNRIIFRRIHAVLLALVLLTATLFLAGCSKDKPETSDAPASSSESAGQGVFLLFNGQKLHIGDEFAALKDALGPESMPCETIKPCDPNSDAVSTLYFYDGVEIMVQEDGSIESLSVGRDSEAALLGEIRPGSDPDALKASLGDPSDENEYALIYIVDSVWINAYLDEGIISGFYITFTVN
ncbi:MAG: hypothetical protein IKZ41_11685 [Clostridia bacterium]|nr:hypothetical protein [Clostridia bacterium]MBR5366614.1 hypothetical protein [Clostridia bacterium]